eukprot:365977-Chlamydomonas_euryale.AAC.11
MACEHVDSNEHPVVETPWQPRSLLKRIGFPRIHTCGGAFNGLLRFTRVTPNGVRSLAFHLIDHPRGPPRPSQSQTRSTPQVSTALASDTMMSATSIAAALRALTRCSRSNARRREGRVWTVAHTPTWVWLTAFASTQSVHSLEMPPPCSPPSPRHRSRQSLVPHSCLERPPEALLCASTRECGSAMDGARAPGGPPGGGGGGGGIAGWYFRLRASDTNLSGSAPGARDAGSMEMREVRSARGELPASEGAPQLPGRGGGQRGARRGPDEEEERQRLAPDSSTIESGDSRASNCAGRSGGRGGSGGGRGGGRAGGDMATSGTVATPGAEARTMGEATVGLSAWRGMVLYDMTWHSMAWHGIAWHGMAWHGTAGGCTVWHGMIWHAME